MRHVLDYFACHVIYFSHKSSVLKHAKCTVNKYQSPNIQNFSSQSLNFLKKGWI